LPQYALWTIGGDDEQRQVAIECFGYGGDAVEKSRARRDAYSHRLLQSKHHAEGYESRTALVGDGMERKMGRQFVKIVYNGGVARTRTDHNVTKAMLKEQRGKLVDLMGIAEHGKKWVNF